MNFLIDCDGVLYKGSKPIKGAQQTIDFLEENKISFQFATNTNSKTKQELLKKFKKIGFKVKQEQFFTALEATIIFLKENFSNTKIFSLQNPSVFEEMKFHGFNISNSLEEDFKEFDLVLLGVDYFLTFEKLNFAFNALLNGAKLIAVSDDKVYPGDNKTILGPGAFIKALEFSLGKKAIIIGKPNKEFFKQALKKLNSSANETFMIGDNLELDIVPAKQLGLKTILVKTGIFNEKNLQESKIKPDFILNSIADLPDWISNQ